MSRSAFLRLSSLAMVAMRASAVYSFVTWGFEDYDYIRDSFTLSFPTPVSIMHIEGFVSASMLPHSPKEAHNDRHIRQALLACHNGTRAPLHGEAVIDPKRGPGQERRFEHSLTVTPVEINIKQQDRSVIHLPVNYRFRFGEVIVLPEHGFTCVSDLITYTGFGEGAFEKRQSVDGQSVDPLECLDLEVHFNVNYVPLSDAKAAVKASGQWRKGQGLRGSAAGLA